MIYVSSRMITLKIGDHPILGKSLLLSAQAGAYVNKSCLGNYAMWPMVTCEHSIGVEKI